MTFRSGLRVIAASVVSMLVAIPAAFGATNPSPAALTLARALHIRPSILLGGDVTEAEMVSDASSRLLHTGEAAYGGPCDPSIPACRASADRFALEEVKIIRTTREQMSVELFASILDEHLTSEQMQRLTVQAASAEQRELIAALLEYDDPRSMSVSIRQMYAAITTKYALAQQPAIDAVVRSFYENIKGLPRAQFFAPPPPSIPPVKK